MKHTTADWMPHGISDPFHSFHWLDFVHDIVETWKRRARTRRDLAELDDRLLRDIGVDRVDRRAEVNKPFWRA